MAKAERKKKKKEREKERERERERDLAEEMYNCMIGGFGVDDFQHILHIRNLLSRIC